MGRILDEAGEQEKKKWFPVIKKILEDSLKGRIFEGRRRKAKVNIVIYQGSERRKNEQSFSNRL